MKQFLLISLSFLILTASAHAQEQQQVIVDISGMKCKFCAYSVEKSLTKLEDIEKSSVDIEKGIANIVMAPGKTCNLKQIKTLINNAGFSPGEIRVVKHNM